MHYRRVPGRSGVSPVVWNNLDLHLALLLITGTVMEHIITESPPKLLPQIIQEDYMRACHEPFVCPAEGTYAIYANSHVMHLDSWHNWHAKSLCTLPFLFSITPLNSWIATVKWVYVLCACWPYSQACATISNILPVTLLLVLIWQVTH
jgi:hypothetical protein